MIKFSNPLNTACKTSPRDSIPWPNLYIPPLAKSTLSFTALKGLH